MFLKRRYITSTSTQMSFRSLLTRAPTVARYDGNSAKRENILTVEGTLIPEPQAGLSDNLGIGILTLVSEKYCRLFHFPFQRLFDALQKEGISGHVDFLAIELHETTVDSWVGLSENTMVSQRTLWRICCRFLKTF